MNMVSTLLIISNAARLLIRKMFKVLISLFYVFTFLAVISNTFSYSIMIYWALFKTKDDEVSQSEADAFLASLLMANFSQFFLLAATILTMYQLTLALQILLKEMTERQANVRIAITALLVFSSITAACIVVVFTRSKVRVNILCNAVQLCIAILSAIIYLFLRSKLQKLGYGWLKKPV